MSKQFRAISLVLAVILAFTLLPLQQAFAAPDPDTSAIDAVNQKWYEYIVGTFTPEDAEGAAPGSALRIYLDDTEQKAQASYTLLLDWKAKNAANPPSAANGYTRSYVFEHLPCDTTQKNNTTSGYIRETYSALRPIVLAYKTPGTSLYNKPEVLNDIIDAFGIMYFNEKYTIRENGTYTWTTNASGNQTTSWGNWYHWDIGIPLVYNELLMMLRPELEALTTTRTKPNTPNFTGRGNTPSTTPYENWFDMLLHVVECSTRLSTTRINLSSQETGANRTWKVSVSLHAAAMRGNVEVMEAMKAGLKDKTVLDLVTSGDGFYADGSFLQHTNYPYTGGYGASLIETLSRTMYILAGSPWELTYDDGFEKTLLDNVMKSYSPFLWRGSMMDITRDREVTVHYSQDWATGGRILRGMMLLATLMEGEQKAELERFVKLQLGYPNAYMSAHTVDGVVSIVSPIIFNLSSAILNNPDIVAADPASLNKTFGSMTRTVHLRGDDYGFSLAMYGQSIRPLELTNTEGLRTHSFADGATYLYNADVDKYADHYWGTVDPARLPGTTVERVAANNGLRAARTSTALSANSYGYAGGVSLGSYGAAAQQYRGSGTAETNSGTSNIVANKSWFMFDDEIVAIGSGITSSTGQQVETIVENYKLKSADDAMVPGPALPNRDVVPTTAPTTTPTNILYVNGVDSTASATGLKTDVSTVHLQGNVEGSDVGYYFPQSPDLQFLREKRQQGWYLQSQYATSTRGDDFIRSYQTFWFAHGANPTNDTYEYVILPGATPEETQAYAENPAIEILQNDNVAQAVRHTGLNILGVNFVRSQTNATAQGITVSNEALVMVQQREGEVEIAIAEPRQNRSSLTVDLDLAALGLRTDGTVLATSAGDAGRIAVSKPDENTVRIVVNTSSAAGRTFTVTLETPKPVTLGISTPGGGELNDPIEYIFTMKNMERVMNVRVRFELDTNMLVGSNLELLHSDFSAMNDGNSIIRWTPKEDGIYEGEFLLMYLGGPDGLTSDAATDVAKLIFAAKQYGAATVTLTGLLVTGLDEDGNGVTLDSAIAPAQATAIVAKVYSKYDLNKDDVIDQRDLAMAQRYYMVRTGDANWAAAQACDFIADGVVDMLDLLDLFLHFT